MTRTLVIGGGGVTGVSWALGVVEGLRRSGIDLSTADTIIGTSAGSVVGTRLALGPIEIAYAEQLTEHSAEIPAKIGIPTLVKIVLLFGRGGDETVKFKRIGKAARSAEPKSTTAERMDVIRSRVGDPAWPDRDLRITAVDIDAGRFEVFDRTSSASLLEAVAASCAVPMVWPPVVINGTTYVDGGARSPVNADLAVGADDLVVIAPMPDSLAKEHHLDKQFARAGSPRTVVVSPDKDAQHDMGSNSLDPSRRRASAEAGLRQGIAAATEVLKIWG